ncbi:hypothetical protein HFO10_17155 [Rhizobium laguerreae]|nr:hypothetical protein [Rhizobium laguerreae]
MRWLSVLVFVTSTMSMHATAFANCSDIKQRCWENYQLDSAVCEEITAVNNSQLAMHVLHSSSAIVLALVAVAKHSTSSLMASSKR